MKTINKDQYDFITKNISEYINNVDYFDNHSDHFNCFNNLTRQIIYCYLHSDSVCSGDNEFIDSVVVILNRKVQLEKLPKGWNKNN